MGSRLLPGNHEDREVYLCDHRAGNFVEAVPTTVIMSVEAFAGEPEVLYGALNHAHTAAWS